MPDNAGANTPAPIALLRTQTSGLLLLPHRPSAASRGAVSLTLSSIVSCPDRTAQGPSHSFCQVRCTWRWSTSAFPSLPVSSKHVCRLLVCPEPPRPGDSPIHPPDTNKPFTNLQDRWTVILCLRSRFNSRGCRHGPCSSWLLPCHHTFYRRDHRSSARVPST